MMMKDYQLYHSYILYPNTSIQRCSMGTSLYHSYILYPDASDQILPIWCFYCIISTFCILIHPTKSMQALSGGCIIPTFCILIHFDASNLLIYSKIRPA